jgi:hypothetical protein
VEVGAEMTNIVEVKIEKRNKDFRKIMHEKVDEICDLLEDGGEIAAYAIVGFDFNGQWSNCYRIDNSVYFGHTMLPALVAETLRTRNTQDNIDEALKGSLK